MRFLAKILLIVGITVALESCCIKCYADCGSGGCLSVGQVQWYDNHHGNQPLCGCDSGSGCQCGPVDDCYCGYWCFQAPAPYVNFDPVVFGLGFGFYQRPIFIRYNYRPGLGFWSHRRHR